MEAMWLVTIGAAHDFNNILTGIPGYSGLAMLRMNPNNSMHQASESIRSLTEWAANLTIKLLAFGRKQVVHH
jgi:C4-dicarboxylate-specific signal transduction histidine kinase